MFTIRNKLYFGFGLILLFILAQFAVVFVYLKQSEKLVDNAISRDFHTSVEVARIGIEAQKLRRFEKEYLMYIHSPSNRGKYFIEWKEASDAVAAKLRQIIENRDQLWSNRDAAAAREWQQSLDAYVNGFKEVVAAVDNGQITSTLQGNDAVRDAKDAFRVLLDGTAKKIEIKYERAAVSAKAVEGKFQLVTIVLVVVALAGTVLAAAMLVLLPTSIGRPIEMLTRAAHDMSTGNLGKAISVSGSPEFKELGATLERMRVSQQMIIDRLTGKTRTA
jgi:nitrate/nitrite-specific signal transduction histidine kinase